MRKERNSWPVVDVNVQIKKEEKAKSGEEDEELNTCQDQVSTTLLASQTQPVKKSKSEKHIFSGTIQRCSRVDVLVRAVARVKNIFKYKSFKIKEPSFQDEEEAFSTLVRMSQKSLMKLFVELKSFVWKTISICRNLQQIRLCTRTTWIINFV